MCEWRWVPIRVNTRIYSLDNTGTFGELANEVEFVVDRAKSRWNEPVPPSRFEMPVPAGVTVVDVQRGTQYVTGNSDAGKNLADLAANAAATVQVDQPLKPQVTSWQWWAALAAAFIIVPMAIVVMRRESRRRALQ